MEAKDFLNDKTPLEKLKEWMTEAKALSLREPNAMCLSTVGIDRRPTSRIVLMRDLRPEGLVFYTNYESTKGLELEENAVASANFYWDATQRQVRLEGTVAKVSGAESDSYWNSRHKASQISQWISKQSEVVASREALEKAYAVAEAEFADKPVPRPTHWGGYLLTVDQIEFWIGHPHRLHDRFLYRLHRSGWVGERLMP